MTKIDFIKFLDEFGNSLRTKPNEWENKRLPDFLEAMQRFTEDVQGYYDNMNMNVDSEVATWENFKTILLGASVYE